MIEYRRGLIAKAVRLSDSTTIETDSLGSGDYTFISRSGETYSITYQILSSGVTRTVTAPVGKNLGIVNYNGSGTELRSQKPRAITQTVPANGGMIYLAPIVFNQTGVITEVFVNQNTKTSHMRLGLYKCDSDVHADSWSIIQDLGVVFSGTFPTTSRCSISGLNIPVEIGAYAIAMLGTGSWNATGFVHSDAKAPFFQGMFNYPSFAYCLMQSKTHSYNSGLPSGLTYRSGLVPYASYVFSCGVQM